MRLQGFTLQLKRMSTKASMSPTSAKDIIQINKIVPMHSSNLECKPSHHAVSGFINPWTSFKKKGLTDVLKWKFMGQSISNAKHYPPVEVIPLDVDKLFQVYNGNTNEKLMVSWLGHACMLVTMPGLNIIFDPCLSDRCSPLSWVGPQRLHDVPCDFRQLPPIDILFISHNHYDHLDFPSLKTLVGDETRIFVPLGLKQLLESQGFTRIIECDWWDEHQVLKTRSKDKSIINAFISCTPAQHFSSRSLFDRDQTLWCGWVLKAFGKSFYFAGDTGYRSVEEGMTRKEIEGLAVCPEFTSIGNKYGPFDLSAIPIGAYLPRWFMSSVHCDPFDAIGIHIDVKSKRSIGMHFGTFQLSDEPLHEPPFLLQEEIEKINENIQFETIKIGGHVLI